MVISGYRNDGTEILDLESQNINLVKGLYSKISSVIGKSKLPLPIDITILPFNGMVTYSGYIKEIGIDFGNSLAQMVLDQKR